MSLEKYSEENLKKISDIANLIVRQLEFSDIDFEDYNIIPMQQFHRLGYSIEDVRSAIRIYNRELGTEFKVVNDEHSFPPSALMLLAGGDSTSQEVEWANFITSNALLVVNSNEELSALKGLVNKVIHADSSSSNLKGAEELMSRIKWGKKQARLLSLLRSGNFVDSATLSKKIKTTALRALIRDTRAKLKGTEFHIENQQKTKFKNAMYRLERHR